MNRYIIFLCLFSILGTSCQNSSDAGAKKINAVIISYTQDGWKDYNDTGETVADVILVKITEPNKYAGREITIIDDRLVFRKAGLTKNGKVVSLALYDGIQIDGGNDEFFVSAFRDIGHGQDIPTSTTPKP